MYGAVPAHRQASTRVCSPCDAAGAAASAGGARTGRGRSAWSSPLTELLNSRMPLPSDFPISGSRFGPSTTRAMIMTMTSWIGDTSGIESPFEGRGGGRRVSAGRQEPRRLVGVRRERVQVGIGRRALLHLVEVVEASRPGAGLTEAEAGRLELLHGDEDVLKARQAGNRRVGRGLLLVELHEDAIVPELPQRLTRPRPVHRFDAHELRGDHRIRCVPLRGEVLGADQIRVDEDLIADLERAEEV